MLAARLASAPAGERRLPWRTDLPKRKYLQLRGNRDKQNSVRVLIPETCDYVRLHGTAE